MFETLSENIFCIKLPLPNTPLKSLNSVVIKGKDRTLVIDTGLNHDECFKAMDDSLTALDVDRNKTDFMVTHFHADHFGLLSRLITKDSKLYFNAPEAEILKNWENWEPALESAKNNGFPEHQLRSALESHPGFKFHTDWIPEMEIVHDNDIITIGDYDLQCIETPGHTVGHICLYEPKNKIFIAGDHILGDISPNIQGWEENEFALADYFRSLDKVYPLDVNLVVPGHRSVLTDFRGRINALKAHHDQRLLEVQSIIASDDCNAYQTAARMQWDIRARSWEDFPIAQKWFATGEALAHLQYLEQQGHIKKQLIDGIFVYSIH